MVGFTPDVPLVDRVAETVITTNWSRVTKFLIPNEHPQPKIKNTRIWTAKCLFLYIKQALEI